MEKSDSGAAVRLLKFTIALTNKSGWQLKEPLGGPPGVYNGLNKEDYEYIGYENTLDRCNCGYTNGEYIYFFNR